MNDPTYYVAARDQRGNRIGLYVEADNADSAWDLAQERADIELVEAVQLLEP